MKIKTIPGSDKWTDFETKEWENADKKHYGKTLDWDKKELALIARGDDDSIIAVLRMEVMVGVCLVVSLIVDEHQRSKGVGRELMIYAEKTAAENGAHKLYLSTGKDWESVEFYKKLGYRITSQLPNHYYHVDFVEMTKFL